MTLAIWRLTPVASPSDPAWQGRRIWNRIEIIAASAGEALLQADRYEREVTGLTDADSQDHQQRRSGFADPTLYRVDRLDKPTPADATPGQIVYAT